MQLNKKTVRTTSHGLAEYLIFCFPHVDLKKKNECEVSMIKAHATKPGELNSIPGPMWRKKRAHVGVRPPHTANLHLSLLSATAPPRFQPLNLHPHPIGGGGGKRDKRFKANQKGKQS